MRATIAWGAFALCVRSAFSSIEMARAGSSDAVLSASSAQAARASSATRDSARDRTSFASHLSESARTSKACGAECALDWGICGVHELAEDTGLLRLRNRRGQLIEVARPHGLLQTRRGHLLAWDARHGRAALGGLQTCERD